MISGWFEPRDGSLDSHQQPGREFPRPFGKSLEN
jgi:hypothetical protein